MAKPFMKKIGFLFNGSNFQGLDLRNCLVENPGVGGSVYALLTTGTMLADIAGFQVIFYTLEQQCLPEKIIQRHVRTELEAIYMAKADCVDIYIFNVCNYPEIFYTVLNELKLNAVAWVHNYINYQMIRELRVCDAIKRVVFVSQEHYDAYVDDPLIKKSTFIYLMVPQRKVNRKLETEKAVTYVGAICKSKGFHVLAKHWKYIKSQVPEATLYVVGSVKLYRTVHTKSQGIAKPNYEKMFMKYLQDKDGQLLDSVHFMGLLGKEKEVVYEKTYVGVANPTGLTETFCLSAAEFEAHGIPVVTYNGYGLLDTVVTGRTGLTSKSSKKQANYIIWLLKNKEENLRLGQGGQEYTRQNFAPSVVVQDWIKLIDDIINCREAEFSFSGKHMNDNWKWLKYLNYKLHKILPILSGLSICYIVSRIKTLIKKMLKI